MLFYTVGQSRIFLSMLYAGLAVGLYVSLDAAARRLFEAGRVMALAMDLLLGLMVALIVVCALVVAADGELRLYALMGVFCGYLLYQGTLGPLLQALGRFAARRLRALLAWLNARTLVKKIFR